MGLNPLNLIRVMPAKEREYRLAKPSVIVVGAGVAGLACALELSERGLAVELVERGRTLGETSCSWMAGGMLAPWCERATTEPEVATWGAPAIDWWAERFPGTVRNGSLVVTQARDAPDLARFASRTERFEWVDADRIAALEPALAGRFRRALLFPDEAHLDPAQRLSHLVRALLQQIDASRLGVQHLDLALHVVAGGRFHRVLHGVELRPGLLRDAVGVLGIGPLRGFHACAEVGNVGAQAVQVLTQGSG